MSTPSRPETDKPDRKPEGPRTPYPVDHPGVSQQPGSEPDYIPGKSPESLPKF